MMVKPPTTTPPKTLSERVENQLDRIDQGVQSGSLTAQQASNLSQRDYQIQQQIAQAKAANGGKLTPEQHKQFESELNNSSKNIFDKKHDIPQNLQQRSENQNRRIDQGIKSGALTPGQASQLQNREMQLQREMARARAQNGGTIPPDQKAQIEQQFNQLSQQIYAEKHPESASPDLFTPGSSTS